ncbi:MAG: efflux RND transporter periplasmic adaptor subunit [Gammaproteobacteria bacterium]|nr:efflux RND transporter periplasmic adaptor subunit [Gammaproteobacteria bacterium]MDE2250192.1 efflux RND transporter periplasmic adaptor subunit [Gammaproteobacteria bacterium]
MMNDVPESTPPVWRRMPSRRAWALIAIVALVAVVALIIRHGRGLQAAGQGGRGGPMAVAIATAAIGDIDVRLPALGTVTPLATVTVKTQISGQLQQIAFKEGQLVKRGDFLAQIDPRPYQAALAQALGNLRRDQALLANARVDLKRYQDLGAHGVVAEQQVATQQATVQQFEGTVATDEGQVSNARLNLQYTHIVAPVAGRVGLRQVDQGNYVTPADANGIVVVTQLQPVSVIFPLPEDKLPGVRKRVHDGAALTVEAWDKANTTRLATGELQSMDNVIDPATGTIKMRALFANADGALFANQFVNIQLLQDVLKGQVIIPLAAVQHGAPGGANSTFVYLVGADSTVTVRPIVLGVTDGERVAVASGLKAGDVVVTEGGDRLRDGATVMLPQNGPGAAGGAPSAPPGNGRNRRGSVHHQWGGKSANGAPGSR